MEYGREREAEAVDAGCAQSSRLVHHSDASAAGHALRPALAAGLSV